MAQGTVRSFIANGNVLPYSFVKMDATAPFKVIQAAAASDVPIGIAAEYTQATPLPSDSSTQYAATAGNELRVYSVGTRCLLKAGSGGLTVGNRVVSDASGNGVTGTTGQISGAVADGSAASGELCWVLVTDPITI